MIIQNNNEMIRANKFMFVYRRGVYDTDCFAINCTGFLLSSSKNWNNIRIFSSFLLLFNWNKTQPIPIRGDSAVIKNGGSFSGSVTVRDFILEALIYLNSVSSSLIRRNLIVS